MFEWITFFDRNKGPIFSNNFPPMFEDIFGPKILKKMKHIITNINSKKYLIFLILN